MLRVVVRRPREFRVPDRLGDRADPDRLGEDVRLRVEPDRFAEPEREGLDRFTEEPLMADRLPPPPERPRWAKAAS